MAHGYSDRYSGDLFWRTPSRWSRSRALRSSSPVLRFGPPAQCMPQPGRAERCDANNLTGYDLGVLPSELDDDHALRDLLDIDEHLLWFQPRPDGGATCAVILFGAIEYALRVPDADLTNQPTWLLLANNAVKREPDAFSAVFARLIERARERDPAGRWAGE